MLNNILNGWRLVITKIALAIGLVYLIYASTFVIVRAFASESKWECGSTKEVYEYLSLNDEEVIASGTVDDRFIMTFWANPRAEWSVVVTSTKTFEASCVVIYGNNHKKQRVKTFI